MIFLLICFAFLSPRTILDSGLGVLLGPIFAASGFLGSWYVPVVFRRYRLRQRMKSVWGWPRSHVLDLMALMVWIAIIMALAGNALQFRPIRYYV